MASSNKTSKLGLNKWEGTDKVQRQDFNDDNDTLDRAFGADQAQGGHDHSADGKGAPIPIGGLATAAKTTPGGTEANRLAVTDNNGKVGAAKTADTAGSAGSAAAVPWTGVSGRPPTFTPSGHKSNHAIGGTDALSPSDIGAQKNVIKSNLPPNNPAVDDLWIDTSVTPNLMKRYTGAVNGWQPVGSNLNIPVVTSDDQIPAGCVLWIRSDIPVSEPSILQSRVNNLEIANAALEARVALLEQSGGGGLNPRLVAWYRMNEASGNIVADSVGVNHGTATGTTIVAGLGGSANARSFGATGADYIDFPAAVIPLGAKTIKARIKKSNNMGATQTILDNCGGSSSNHGSGLFLNSAGQLTFRNSKGTGGTYNFAVAGTTNLCDGLEHLIKVTWDGTTNAGGVKVYVDDMNTPQATGIAIATETTASTFNMRIGFNAGNLLPFDGIIDEVEIYDAVVA